MPEGMVPMRRLPLSSVSPNLSASEEENQSPISVLSAIGSDATTDSDMSNGSPFPISSAAVNGGAFYVLKRLTFFQQNANLLLQVQTNKLLRNWSCNMMIMHWKNHLNQPHSI